MSLITAGVFVEDGIIAAVKKIDPCSKLERDFGLLVKVVVWHRVSAVVNINFSSISYAMFIAAEEHRTKEGALVKTSSEITNVKTVLSY